MNNLTNIYNMVGTVAGDKATFDGLAFNFDSGYLLVDFYDEGTGHNDAMLICHFIPHDLTKETETFAAKGIEELREQIEHYILK
jgi:hypothetical protein